MTTVVHCKEHKFDVYIGRPCRQHAGSKFRIGRDGTREEVCAKYRRWFVTQPDLICQLDELRGKVLGCWCHPKECHGEFLAAFADLGYEEN